MPSPAMTHSKSAPDIHAPPPTKSVVTSRSAGSPLATWHKKLGGLIKGKPSDLTEQRLIEFNRRNALIEARYSGSSPYYKGLTDSTKIINREKQAGSSPGRESRATSSGSSFVVRVQEWGGSCFTPRKINDKSSSSSFDNRLTTASSSSSSSRVTETLVLTKIIPKTAQKRVTIQSTKMEDATTSPSAKKPLRERDFGASPSPLPMLPLSPPASLPYPQPQIQAPLLLSLSPPPTPPPQALLQPSSTAPAAAENERRYMWSDRYRPFWLQDFLCNREKALWLQKMVRSCQDKQEACGHFIFEGNTGVGKRTMIWALLREAFGPDKVQVHPNSHMSQTEELN